MAYRKLNAGPRSRLVPERQGQVMARFCLGCESFYSPLAARHQGKPLLGKDHVSAPCPHEGEAFAPGAAWWEDAVEILPAPPPAAE